MMGIEMNERLAARELLSALEVMQRHAQALREKAYRIEGASGCPDCRYVAQGIRSLSEDITNGIVDWRLALDAHTKDVQPLFAQVDGATNDNKHLED